MSHPSQDEILQWLTVKLGDKEASVVERHLGTCQVCSDLAIALEEYLVQKGTLDVARRKLPSLDRNSSQKPISQPGAVADDTIDSLPNQFAHNQATPPISQKANDTPRSSDSPNVSRAPEDDQNFLANIRELSSQRYEKGNVIATGGMGEIHDALDRCVRRHVAMKVMRRGKTDHKKLVRFIEEAQITGQLEHPSIVPVHDLGVDKKGNLFYTMKFARGKTLKKVLSQLSTGHPKTSEEFTLSRLLEIFQRSCDAIAFAHSHNVIHRDIKPENIMVGEFGEVLVLDWGLAKSIERGEIRKTDAKTSEFILGINSIRMDADSEHALTMDGDLLGTPAFMSPEQASGKSHAVDERSDIYALGAVLYNLLTFRLPIQEKDLRLLLSSIIEGKIESPDKAVIAGKHRQVPPALASVCMKALAVKPEDRYQSVHDFQADLRSFQSGFATSTEKAGFVRQFQLLVRRNAGIAASVAIATLLGLALTGVYIRRINFALEQADANALQASINEKEAVKAKELAIEAEKEAESKRKEALNQLSQTKIALANAAYLSGDNLGALKYLQECSLESRDSNWRYIFQHSDEAIYHQSMGYVRGILADPLRPGMFYIIRQNGTLAHVDGRTGKTKRSIQLKLGYGQIAMSPDGQQIAYVPRAFGDQEVLVISTDPLKVVNKIITPIGGHFVTFFANDSKTLFIGFEKGKTVIVDTEEGTMDYWNEDVIAKTASPTRPIVVGFKSNKLSALNFKSNQLLWKTPSAGWLYEAKFNHDETRVVTLSNSGEIGIHDASNGRLLKRFRAHDTSTNFMPRLCCSKRSNLFFTFANGPSQKQLKLWHTEQKGADPLRQYACAGSQVIQFDWDMESGLLLEGYRQISAFQISDDSLQRLPIRAGVETLLSLSDNEVAIWNDRMMIVDPQDPSASPKRLNQYRRLARSFDRGITLLHELNQKKAYQLSAGQIKLYVEFGNASYGAAAAAVSQDGNYVAAAPDFPWTIVMRRNKDGIWKTVLDLNSNAADYAVGGRTFLFFPKSDSQRLLISYAPRDENAKFRRDYFVYEVDHQKLIAQRSDFNAADTMVLDPKGQVLYTGSPDGMIRGYDAKDLEPIFEFRAHDREVTALAFHPSGQALASGSGSGLIRLWKIKDRIPTTQLKEIVGCLSHVQTLDFTPSGKKLFALSNNDVYTSTGNLDLEQN